MSKSLAASKKVMKNYLSELLTDDPVVEENTAKKLEEKKLESLLSQVSEPKVEQPSITTYKSERSKVEVVEPVIDTPAVEEAPEQPLVTSKSQGGFTPTKEKAYDKEEFQAMFFDVAGLTVAVPLVELGGIHNKLETNSLMGKPDWFSGVMLHRDEKINVVDTARWVMPEKCNDELINSLEYQYVIMLSNSNWGLSAEHLVDTVTLQEGDVKWLDSPSKRPWLAGLVKDRMCALLDVEALIQLLNDGLNVRQ